MHYMATFSRDVGWSENKDGASKGVTARGVTLRAWIISGSESG